MIGMLNGNCQLIGIGEAIIDVGGVGYLVQCSSRTLAALSQGEPAQLHIETHVRETAITLYGFTNEEDRAWFVRLQSVQKVGPKAALAILDTLSPGEILSAANLEDKTAFSRANGVGPSLAGRIVAELAGKPPPTGRMLGGAEFIHETINKAGARPQRGLQKDAISALVNLGIAPADAMRLVAQSMNDDPDASLNAIVKTALKEMAAQNG